MSPSPKDTTKKDGLKDYAASWAAIMDLVRQGHSWSGHERNVCFLNDGAGGFREASYVSGLDFPDDGRAIGFVDWDFDGDVDVWLRNRTAPRLRLMLNQSPRKAAFVAFKLEGNTGNRDAIGARVTVIRDGVKPQAKTLRAGDLFLSQSSKWLHFGLGDSSQAIQEVRVAWPGGQVETFEGMASGQRYRLLEGSGKAALWRSPRPLIALPLKPAQALASTASARMVLPNQIPLPILQYMDAMGAIAEVGDYPKPRLLLLWDSACPHCEKELARLGKEVMGGVEVLALAVRGPFEEARALIEKTVYPHPWGLLDDASVGRVQALQAALFDRAVPLSVPMAILLDSRANALALYRGTLPLEVILTDAQTLPGASPTDRRDLALPYPGNWFSNPAPPAQVAEFLGRQFSNEDAIPYLSLAASLASPERQAFLLGELGARHYELAKIALAGQSPEEAAFHYQHALQFAPDQVSLLQDYGVFLASYGQLKDAATLFQRVLQHDPDNVLAKESLRLVRDLQANGKN